MAREALRAYFLSVVGDLVARGRLRQQRGQSLEDVLRAEGEAVMREVKEDFFAVGAELGLGLASSLGMVVGSAAQKSVDRGAQMIGQWLGEVLGGRKH